ncbi:MAG: ArsR family transcriptional regulator [Deltaproteobacteria bacterium]|nr:ArsR family transcriptional regulator [Deltaproteobacteria bacterium]
MNMYAELIDSDRRLVILRILEEDAGYSMNESVIQSVLEKLGHAVSRDRVRTDLKWLEEQGLVTIEEVVSVQVATLTSRGSDVACGRVMVPGVKRPRPREA